jgi:hypothetical protein
MMQNKRIRGGLMKLKHQIITVAFMLAAVTNAGIASDKADKDAKGKAKELKKGQDKKGPESKGRENHENKGRHLGQQKEPKLPGEARKPEGHKHHHPVRQESTTVALQPLAPVQQTTAVQQTVIQQTTEQPAAA